MSLPPYVTPIAGESSITYNDVVFWPVTEWKIGNGVPETTWLTCAVRFLMGEDSMTGTGTYANKFHIIAQYSAYTKTGTVNGTNSNFRFIRRLGNSVTSTGNEATLVADNSFYSTLNQNYSPFMMVNETTVSNGHFVQYNKPYFVRDCGGLDYSGSVTPANFTVATAQPYNGSYVQEAITDTYTAPAQPAPSYSNVNKVVINGRTAIDLTADTVTAAVLLQGYTAHDKNGGEIIGVYTGGGDNMDITSSGTHANSQSGYSYTCYQFSSGLLVAVFSVNYSANSSPSSFENAYYTSLTVNMPHTQDSNAPAFDGVPYVIAQLRNSTGLPSVVINSLSSASVSVWIFSAKNNIHAGSIDLIAIGKWATS